MRIGSYTFVLIFYLDIKKKYYLFGASEGFTLTRTARHRALHPYPTPRPSPRPLDRAALWHDIEHKVYTYILFEFHYR